MKNVKKFSSFLNEANDTKTLVGGKTDDAKLSVYGDILWIQQGGRLVALDKGQIKSLFNFLSDHLGKTQSSL